MSKLYTTNTAALRAVTIDSNTINTKKLMIYPGTGERTERKDIIEIIDDAINGTLTEELTFNTNTVGGTLDNATVKGIQYSKAHFISDGYITSITIPYNYKSGDENSGYLYIEAINEDGNVVNSGYSIEPSSFNDSSSGEHITTFNFNNFYIPENYKLVRLALVPDKTTTPNIVTTENCLAFRSRPIKLNNNVNYDDDDCIVYTSATKTQNWVIELTVTYNQITGGVIDDIYYNDIRINRILNDISNLTANSQTYITSEDAQLLFANKETIGQEYKLAENASETADCDAIHYKADKVPHDFIIDEIGIPATNTITTPTYLAAWIIDQAGQKTYIGLSDNAIIWNSGDIATWTFKNNPFSIPENYKLELFLTTSEPDEGAIDAPAPGYYIGTYCDYSGSGSMRHNGSWHHGRDIRTIFVKNGIVINHEKRISNLEENVGDLQLKSYAYTDAENIFSSANTFEAPIHTNNIIVDSGVIEFADDGEVTLSNGASGWPYTIFMPDKFENGKIYDLGLLTSDVDLSSVAFDGDDTIVQTAEIWFTLGDTIHNIIWPANVIWIDTIDGTMPPLTANLNYRLSIRKEVKYIVASFSYTFKTPLI